MDALGDLPVWAVREAVRLWRRGLCVPHNYDFAPSEAMLRSVAERVVALARGQCAALQRLLAAQPVEELDEATRAENRVRLVKLLDDLVEGIQARARQVAEDERCHRA